MRKAVIVALMITALLIPSVNAQSTTMQPRVGHRMIYSPEKDIVVMFGGMTVNTGNYYNDLWTYSPRENTWTKITTNTSPSPRGAPGLAYNPDKRECLLFGGLSGSRLSDTWILSLDTMSWSKQSPATSPSARSDTGLVYDRVSKRYILYGGFGTGLQEDTWAYDSEENNWVEIETENSPGKLYGESMMWSLATEQIIMYGGHLNSPVSTSYLNEIWGFNNETQDWEKQQTIDNVQGRYWTAADINENGLLVCFGGSGGNLGDTVEIMTGANNWSTTNLNKPTPSPRFFSQFSYIGGDRFILYGGGTSDQEYGDTWLYNVDTGWSQLEPAITAQGENGIIAPVWMILLGITLAIIVKRYWG